MKEHYYKNGKFVLSAWKNLSSGLTSAGHRSSLKGNPHSYCILVAALELQSVYNMYSAVKNFTVGKKIILTYDTNFQQPEEEEKNYSLIFAFMGQTYMFD